jgi:hypothetical protein
VADIPLGKTITINITVKYDGTNSRNLVLASPTVLMLIFRMAAVDGCSPGKGGCQSESKVCGILVSISQDTTAGFRDRRTADGK